LEGLAVEAAFDAGGEGEEVDDLMGGEMHGLVPSYIFS
jgi:hypothetical protein